MESRNTEAVLFDVDGTLTEGGADLWREAVNTTLRSFDTSITMDQFKALNFGTDLKRLLTFLKIDEIHADNIDRWSNAAYNTLLEERAAWLSGGFELVDKVKEKGRRINVVTHLRRLSLFAQETRLQWQRLFHPDLIVTKDDMEAGGQKRYKPDPFGLQLAAERIGVPIERCCYVGDLENDMIAAQNAGIPGILITSPFTQEGAIKRATRVYTTRAECRKRMHEWLT